MATCSYVYLNYLVISLCVSRLRPKPGELSFEQIVCECSITWNYRWFACLSNCCFYLKRWGACKAVCGM